MVFNPTVFERLLFPLNKRVYGQIQEIIDIIQEKYPGRLKELLENFGVAAQSDTQTPVWRSGREGDTTYPSLDITILFEPKISPKISTLYKSKDYKIVHNYKENTASNYKGSHLVVGYYLNKTLHSFIVPLEYLLGFNEDAVLREGSYQLYSHTIQPLDKQAVINTQLEAIRDTNDYGRQPSVQQLYQKNSFIYVGITKRTWLDRYRQHCNDVCRGSNLLFHRALRGEFCQFGTIEHIVERAGLTAKQAFEIEEKEVEKRSLRSLYPNGLNMIPGGYAGLKYIHHFAARTGYKLDKEVSPENIESILADVQKNALKNHFKSIDVKRINTEIARLWAENIDFRIKATTGQQNRFSYSQIQAARIWFACGWPKEKILENLKTMESKEVGMDQLERLLKGDTYVSIPDVLI